ncbi:hypothetical protein PF002_g15345 [Phytophthora fragariae]|uniref:Uncharacterized protein n=1 Tax=Phytophthora fragariae TaxID=53985 RepID=A0A6A3YNG2_9STRA|nr:hypothetical protein PF002_g15345 [Phytophthora fragariae]
MVKWMAEHRTGREVLKRVKDGNVFVMRDIPRGAAKGGHIGVLEYLFEQGWEDEYASTLVTAAAGGHLECVKWLLEHAPPYGHDHSAESAVVKASENGHLGILQFFHEFETLPAESDEGCTPDALKSAIGNGHLRVAYWLRSLQHFPFNKFPAYNRLWHYPANSFDVVLFLQANYPQFFVPEFARSTKSDIARGNTRQSDLLVVQWLGEKYPGAPTERSRGVLWPLL